eukprot:1315180-Rhodomonas_salina.1
MGGQHSVSSRLAVLVKEMLMPCAMLKQTDRFFLDFRSPAVQQVPPPPAPLPFTFSTLHPTPNTLHSTP